MLVLVCICSGTDDVTFSHVSLGYLDFSPEGLSRPFVYFTLDYCLAAEVRPFLVDVWLANTFSQSVHLFTRLIAFCCAEELSLRRHCLSTSAL